MDLEKAEKLSEKINDLTRKIKRQKENKKTLKHLTLITIETQPSSQGSGRFRMNESSFVGINNPSVKVFKTILMEEIENQIATFEKELDQLIKKGVE